MGRIVTLIACLIPLAAGLSIRNSDKPFSQRQRGLVTVMKRKAHVKGSSFLEKPEKDKYVVMNFFSGRREMLKLALAYAKRLLKIGEIDEVHLNVLQKITSEDDKEWVHTQDDDMIDHHDLWVYTDAYNFYANEWSPPAKFANKTIIAKVDDDVVFMDEKNFGKFTDYVKNHPEMFMVFANTVNNPVCAYYQQKVGAIPMTSNGRDMRMEYPISQKIRKHGLPTWRCMSDDFLGFNAGKAAELHKIFLANPDKFSWKAKENDGCIVYRNPNYPDSQGRFSINFFASMHGHWKEIADLANRRGWKNDEFSLTVDNPNQNCIFTDFVVSHLAFHIQRENGLNETELLKKYAETAFSDKEVR